MTGVGIASLVLVLELWVDLPSLAVGSPVSSLSNVPSANVSCVLIWFSDESELELDFLELPEELLLLLRLPTEDESESTSTVFFVSSVVVSLVPSSGGG